MHEENSFVTLTYKDEELPEHGSLVKKDLQDFMKRLRFSLGGKKVRYYACGEYGEKNDRPHYHVLLFGHMPGSRERLPTRGTHTLWRSGEVAEVWDKGLHGIGEVTMESASYVAGYVMKKAGQVGKRKRYTMEPTTGEVHEIEPEFSTMSRGRGEDRGLGFSWWRKYGEEVERLESVRVMGREVQPPRYYDQLLRERDDAAWQHMKLVRERKHGRYVATGERMARELIAKRRLEMATRRLL